MSFRSTDISILVNAGLTISQAKIYLTLVLNGKQTIKSIAKLSEVDRSNTYREVIKLEELALVKKIISVPNMFQAIPLSDGISLLLAERQKQCEKTKKGLKELLRRFTPRQENLLTEEEKNLFVIPKKTAFMKAAIQQIKAAEVHNDTISSVKRFAQAIQSSGYPVFEIHRRALERGVHTRVIVEKPGSEEFPTKRLKRLMEYPNFQLRYAVSPPKALGSCFDNKRIAIIIEPSENIEESPIFCTYHPSFVAIFHQYFETLWKSALPATNNIIEANQLLDVNNDLQ